MVVNKLLTKQIIFRILRPYCSIIQVLLDIVVFLFVIYEKLSSFQIAYYDITTVRYNVETNDKNFN